MEILGSGNGKIEVVTLACGLVGGGTLMPSTPGSLQSILALLTNDESAYNSLKFLEELLARVPIVHIDDPRFLYERRHYQWRFECLKRETKWVSTLLTERGFEYECDRKTVLDDSVSYAKKQVELGL
ncbi:NADPH HC-toxin reductase 1-like [Primulina huaijiensis]|uniref:NADPH HC-toxin reductase 1-like n=1 Tax=Primulina huaijiensis TaxID=1492673 RepID=UPI003CC6EA88